LPEINLKIRRNKMNKKSVSNKFLAKFGKVIEEPHKPKKEKNIQKSEAVLRRKLNSENTSPIGVTRKNISLSKNKLRIQKNSAKINRNKKRHHMTAKEKKSR
jgi:hypothetical protein